MPPSRDESPARRRGARSRASATRRRAARSCRPDKAGNTRDSSPRQRLPICLWPETTLPPRFPSRPGRPPDPAENPVCSARRSIFVPALISSSVPQEIPRTPAARLGADPEPLHHRARAVTGGAHLDRARERVLPLRPRRQHRQGVKGRSTSRNPDPLTVAGNWQTSAGGNALCFIARRMTLPHRFQRDSARGICVADPPRCGENDQSVGPHRRRRR